LNNLPSRASNLSRGNIEPRRQKNPQQKNNKGMSIKCPSLSVIVSYDTGVYCEVKVNKKNAQNRPGHLVMKNPVCGIRRKNHSIDPGVEGKENQR
jgi:hypothetical protein